MTYDYECLDCGFAQEVQHGMTESPEVQCPSCGALMQRQITGGKHTILKGPGFHRNDYSKDVMDARQANAANKKVK